MYCNKNLNAIMLTSSKCWPTDNSCPLHYT